MDPSLRASLYPSSLCAFGVGQSICDDRPRDVSLGSEWSIVRMYPPFHMEESPRTKHASAFPLAPAPAGAYINFIGRTLLPNIVASGFFCTRYTRRRDRHAAAQACARRAPSRCAKRCLECSARNTGNSGDRVFGSHHRCLECSARNTGNS
eukprot:6474426-Pyramimonas_sp.AAC.2